MLNKKKLFWIGIFVYMVFFFIFYPKFFSITDESAYLKQTYHIAKGEIIIEDVLDSFYYSFVNGKFAPPYHLGASIILLPFILISWKLIFLSGLFFHLLNTYILAKIFQKYKLSKAYSLLYLLYPGLIFYSRTIMSEIPAITFILLGFYFYLKNSSKDVFLAGLMWGLSCLFRPTNALVIVGAMIPLLYDCIKSFIKTKKLVNRSCKKLFYLGLGVLPVFILMISFNSLAYGGPFKLRYGTGSGSIYSQFINLNISQFLVYWKPILILSLIYPLMLFSLFFVKFKKKQTLFWMMLVFLLVLGKLDIFRYSWMVNLVIGQRYFFAIIPLLLIPYSLFLNKYFKRLVPLLFILLILMTPLIMFKQYNYTLTKLDVMEQIYDQIPEDSLIVIYKDAQYVNNYFGNNKAITFLTFKRLDYNGKYYLVRYVNEILFSNLHTQKDPTLEFKKSIKDYIDLDGLELSYNNNGLFIYAHR